MSEELEQLSRRLVGYKGWRWLPGMRVFGGSRVVHVREGGDVLLFLGDVGMREPWEEWRWREDAGIPDLTDPATLGCLLYLVREAWGDPGFYAAQSSVKIKGTDIFGWDTFGYLHGRSCKGMLYRSEAEALVSALESAS